MTIKNAGRTYTLSRAAHKQRRSAAERAARARAPAREWTTLRVSAETKERVAAARGEMSVDEFVASDPRLD